MRGMSGTHLKPIRRPLTAAEWQRLGDNLNSKRGSDQSDVSDRCITRFACMLTPKLERKLSREATRRGCSEAALVRDLIDKGCP
jgi:hypothetical protein